MSSFFFDAIFPRFAAGSRDNKTGMSSISRSLTRPLGWNMALIFIAAATACFQVAYVPNSFAPLHLFILGYVICLIQLARLKTSRQSFYAGLATGFLCIAPQLTCFWNIFGPGAIVLWLILAFWIGAFTGLTHAALERFGKVWVVVLIPVFWMGLEYFRSELYYLKFSWLNIGYALGDFQIFEIHSFGMYGVGFLIALCAGLFLVLRWYVAMGAMLGIILITCFLPATDIGRQPRPALHIAGVQMEFPNERDIPPALDATLAQYTNADMIVLSEYTLDGPVPNSLKDWCRARRRYLVVGGKDPAPKNNYYDSAFVVGPNGEIVFRQVKSVPIQFFKDGLPAPEQKIWDSPWGKIGFCV
jgi:apolipoprotein N-acyltransferase